MRASGLQSKRLSFIVPFTIDTTDTKGVQHAPRPSYGTIHSFQYSPEEGFL